MSILKVLDNESAPEESRAIFDDIRADVGMLPNLYAVLGHSPTALSAYLQFDKQLGSGEFTDREVQAAYLAASEVNKCGYCASAHTAVGQQLGFSKEETEQLRTGNIDDDRLGPLTRLTREIVETRGHADKEFVRAFLDAGFSRAALVELHGLVAIKTFTNYINHLAETPIDFPKAEDLEGELV